MRAGIAVLVLGYVLSQFYRAFLAVLAPVLRVELGVSAADLALASGLWFAVFAAMQIPVGMALDRFGPRRTAGYLFLVGGAGGAAVFAMATGRGGIGLAMVLIGMGCAPVLMAALYIFARIYGPAVFASLAGAMIGLGSAGNLASAAPLAWAAEALGWREALWGIVGLTLLVGIGILALVRDPPRVVGARGGLGAVLRQPVLWVMAPLMVVSYGPAAGIRGLWAGPYLADVFGLDAGRIGVLVLWMALAMILGNFVYGPLDRLLGTRKWVIIGGNLAVAGFLILLWAFPARSPEVSAGLLAGVGFFGASYPMMLAHGRGFFPPHLAGRGVTLANMLGMGGTAVTQVASGRLHAVVAARGGPPEAPFAAIFLGFGVLVLIGTVIYGFSRDRLD